MIVNFSFPHAVKQFVIVNTWCQPVYYLLIFAPLRIRIYTHSQCCTFYVKMVLLNFKCNYKQGIITQTEIIPHAIFTFSKYVIPRILTNICRKSQFLLIYLHFLNPILTPIPISFNPFLTLLNPIFPLVGTNIKYTGNGFMPEDFLLFHSEVRHQCLIIFQVFNTGDN